MSDNAGQGARFRRMALAPLRSVRSLFNIPNELRSASQNIPIENVGDEIKETQAEVYPQARSVISEPPLHFQWEEEGNVSSSDEESQESDNTSMLSPAPTGAMHFLQAEGTRPTRRVLNPTTNRVTKLPEPVTETLAIGDKIFTKKQIREVYEREGNPYKQEVEQLRGLRQEVESLRKSLQESEEIKQKYKQKYDIIHEKSLTNKPTDNMVPRINNVITEPIPYNNPINNVIETHDHTYHSMTDEHHEQHKPAITIKTQAQLDMELRGSIMYFPILDTSSPKVWQTDIQEYINTYLQNCTAILAKNHIMQQLKNQSRNKPALTNALASTKFNDQEMQTATELIQKIAQFFEGPTNAFTSQRKFQSTTMPPHYMETMKYQEFLAMLNMQATQLLSEETEQTRARLVYTTFMEKVGPPRLQFELELKSQSTKIDPKSSASVWAKQSAEMAKEATNIAFTLDRHGILWTPMGQQPTRTQQQTLQKQMPTKHNFINNISTHNGFTNTVEKQHDNKEICIAFIKDQCHYNPCRRSHTLPKLTDPCTLRPTHRQHKFGECQWLQKILEEPTQKGGLTANNSNANMQSTAPQTENETTKQSIQSSYQNQMETQYWQPHTGSQQQHPKPMPTQKQNQSYTPLEPTNTISSPWAPTQQPDE